jgi:hypothetical protein
LFQFKQKIACLANARLKNATHASESGCYFKAELMLWHVPKYALASGIMFTEEQL